MYCSHREPQCERLRERQKLTEKCKRGVRSGACELSKWGHVQLELRIYGETRAEELAEGNGVDTGDRESGERESGEKESGEVAEAGRIPHEIMMQVLRSSGAAKIVHSSV